jgi:hypothetical protein
MLRRMSIKRIIQFLHPGEEHGVDRRLNALEGWKDWNCRAKHKRKFLFADGFATQSPQASPNRHALTFWGEWEPQSRVRTVAKRGENYPEWLHTPELNLDFLKTISPNTQASCRTATPQNTDPLVFGDRFRYVFCQQIKDSRPTTLASLNIGDIVLFGSCIADRTMFALDTVFVVDVHSLVRRDNRFPDWESDLHRQVTMNLIQIPAFGLRLYGGKTWSPDKPFSFVPCLPATPHPTGFPRPVIEPSGPLKNIITPTKSQGYKIEKLDEQCAHAAWDAVVAQVTSQGCYLGTLIDEPDLGTRAQNLGRAASREIVA